MCEDSSAEGLPYKEWLHPPVFKFGILSLFFEPFAIIENDDHASPNMRLILEPGW